MIPSIDLSHFTKGNSQQQQAFVQALGNAFETYGFVAVCNHGIADQLVDDFYASVRAFFALPLDTKEKYEIEGLGGQRGYTSFGKEHAKNSPFGDLKEFWQIGQTVTDPTIDKSHYPDNIAVAELPEFLAIGNQLFKSFEDAGIALLKAIALHLQLDENYFDAHVHQGNSILRAIHYPPITGDPKSALRSEQHEDINLITLLVGASADGLQLLTKQNEWLPVLAPPGHIIVNVGDMLQRLTNNQLRSTTHRVVNPPRERWHEPRLSIPFFLHPRSEMSLAVLPHCITASEPKHYDDITAGAYLHERLVEIGLIKA